MAVKDSVCRSPLVLLGRWMGDSRVTTLLGLVGCLAAARWLKDAKLEVGANFIVVCVNNAYS